MKTNSDKKMNFFCLEPDGTIFQKESDTQVEENIRIFVDQESMNAYKLRQIPDKYEWKAMSALFKDADTSKTPREVSIQKHFDEGWKVIGGALRREKK